MPLFRIFAGFKNSQATRVVSSLIEMVKVLCSWWKTLRGLSYVICSVSRFRADEEELLCSSLWMNTRRYVGLVHKV